MPRIRSIGTSHLGRGGRRTCRPSSSAVLRLWSLHSDWSRLQPVGPARTRRPLRRCSRCRGTRQSRLRRKTSGHAGSSSLTFLSSIPVPFQDRCPASAVLRLGQPRDQATAPQTWQARRGFVITGSARGEVSLTPNSRIDASGRERAVITHWTYRNRNWKLRDRARMPAFRCRAAWAEACMLAFACTADRPSDDCRARIVHVAIGRTRANRHVIQDDRATTSSSRTRKTHEWRST